MITENHKRLGVRMPLRKRIACAVLCVLAAIAVGTAWHTALPQLKTVFFLLPAAALLLWLWPDRHRGQPSSALLMQALSEGFSFAYALAVLRPGAEPLSDFQIVTCSTDFPAWFALDRRRIPGVEENGFQSYNARMHQVLRTRTAAAFPICDRAGGLYDLRALYLSDRWILLTAVPVGGRGSAPFFGQLGHGGFLSDESGADVFHKFKMLNYSISHEVKAPVRAIDGYARIFLEDYSPSIDAEAAQLIQNIRNICGDTIRLINDMLEYSRMTDVAMNPGIIDMEKIMKSVFQELQLSYARKHETHFQLDSHLPPILGDDFLMRQALRNIFSNALKFTKDKPVGIVCAGYLKKRNEGIFYIRDNGAGFDMKFSHHLFGIFQRMHSQEEFEGSGIGLATVKEIIQKHGGRVWITGEVGVGATIYFALKSNDILD